MATHTTSRAAERDSNTTEPGFDGRPAAGDHRSINAMIKELRDQTTTLFREEVALAKSEISEKVSRIARNGGYLAAGALVAFAGLIVLLMAASAGLYAGLAAAGIGNMLAGWLAPLIVGAVVIAIGYGLVQKAITTFQNESLVPVRTTDSVREDAQWMKRKVK
jgi:hypothetical protein